MVVDNFDCMGTIVEPDEHDTLLGVDPNGVLTRAIAVQGLQPVAWRTAEVLQTLGGVDRRQLAPRCPGQIARHAPWYAASKDQCNGFTAEAADHGCT
jgi:hypothetical protein